MATVEIDMDSIKKVGPDGIEAVVGYLGKNEVAKARVYIDIAKKHGIISNIIAGEMISYDSVMSVLEHTCQRQDIKEDVRKKAIEYRNFWKQEDHLLRNGFYGLE
jgi:hypothetical protein